MDLRVELRKGGLEAVAFLDQGPYEAPTAIETVSRQLKEMGVPVADNPAALQMALGAFESGHAPEEGVVIARGQAPQQGVPAQIVAFFPVRDTPLEADQDPFIQYPTNVAYTGEPVLQKTPPSTGIPGKSLLGAPLPAPNGTDVPVFAGDGVVADDDGTYRSTAYGVILFANGRLQVVDAVHIDEDRMEAHMSVLPDTRVDEATQLGKIKAALDQLGVRAGIDEPVLKAAIQASRASGKATEQILVAKGQPPVHGRETDYKVSFDLEQKIGKELEGGRIDFREVEAVQNVSKGEFLAEVIPGIEPVNGFRIDGSPIRARIDRAQGLKPGQNVEPGPDGTHIVASASGMVVIKGGQFHIADQYLVSGNVDYRTGNIRATGDVEIRGQIKPGFEVETEKSVSVTEDVEEATIKAGHDVLVRGGVTGSSRITAGHDVSVRYVLNSHIEAEGDLEVQMSITNSKVYVHGKVLAVKGKGTIMGGETNATLGLEARAIGAEAADTHVAVGIDLKVLRDLEAIDEQREALAKAMRQLQAGLSPGFLKDPRAALGALPVAMRRPKLEILQKIKDIFQKDSDLKAQRDMLSLENQTLQRATVAVQGEVFAGTRVTISTASIKTTEPLRRVLFYYDKEANQISWRKL